jgi:hypothetical protein
MTSMHSGGKRGMKDGGKQRKKCRTGKDEGCEEKRMKRSRKNERGRGGGGGRRRRLLLLLSSSSSSS